MSTQEVVGTVVVGLGIAGRVRVRDLKEESNGLRLRGVVSRRPVDLPDVEGLALDKAVSKEDVNALIICTENKTHEEYVKLGLENGKHVLVEFPIALSVQKAKELYALATEKGLVLCEENIALLTDTHRLVKSKAEQVGIKSVTYSLDGGYNGWIENLEESGLPFISGVSSIQTMLDLFGDLNVIGGKLEMREDGHTATAQLETQSQKPIIITYSRKKSKESFRKKSAIYEFLDGEIIDLDKIPSKPPSKPGLFMQDMQNFYQAILDGRNDPKAQERSIRSLEIAEKIHSFFEL